VLLANAAAELLRNLYTAATVYSGHISADHAVFPADTQPETKGEWYWMQAVASANFEVPRALSLLCGGLDNHIEHHFFPRLPPERIRAIVPEVRAVCERHGVPYKTARWPRVLANVARQFLAMSRKPR
jgi:NADPH-dependent stearoyl-CoA 9-desaturase